MKRSFAIDTKIVVSIICGAVIFTLMHLLCQIPTPISNLTIQLAYAVGGLLSVVFGPVIGALSAFLGHFIADELQGVPGMSWIIASAVACFFTGLCGTRLKLEEGIFTIQDAILYNVFQISGNILAWIMLAPALDIAMFTELGDLVVVQGIWRAISNMLTMGILGTPLLLLYSKFRAKSIVTK